MAAGVVRFSFPGELVVDKGAVIGSGSFGVVKRGTLVATGEPVAVKVFNYGPTAIEEAQHELAKMLSLSHHRNIVELRGFAVDDDEGKPMLVMELATRNLKQILRSTPALDAMTMARLLLQVASGLQHLHEPDEAHGKFDKVYHLDLKPENVLLFDNSNAVGGGGAGLVAKLCDFGLSKSTQATPLPTLSRSVGTPMYRAPEQFSANSPVGPPNDVYSLGVVMWEWLTQSVPWAGHDDLQIMRVLCVDKKSLIDACGLHVAVPDCPDAILALTRRCLSVVPSARPSVLEVMAILKECVLRAATHHNQPQKPKAEAEPKKASEEAKGSASHHGKKKSWRRHNRNKTVVREEQAHDVSNVGEKKAEASGGVVVDVDINWSCEELRRRNFPKGSVVRLVNAMKRTEIPIGSAVLGTTDWAVAACIHELEPVSVVLDASMSTVTSLGDGFLHRCSSVQSVDLSPWTNVTVVGSNFLCGCSSIKTVDLSPFTNVTTVGNCFLRECTSIEIIDLRSLTNVTKVDSHFLFQCSALRRVTLPHAANAKMAISREMRVDTSKVRTT